MSHDLDLRGTRCPVSTMRLKKHLRSVPKGTTIWVLANDDDARTDFPALIAKTGSEFKSFKEAGDHFAFEIEVR
ncbi:MAG: sulfurtransferase TusA family protein [Hyphomicrobiaceae bacterium]